MQHTMRYLCLAVAAAVLMAACAGVNSEDVGVATDTLSSVDPGQSLSPEADSRSVVGRNEAGQGSTEGPGTDSITEISTAGQTLLCGGGTCIDAETVGVSGVVTKVVDGDTVDVRVGEETLRVRLSGVNTPEQNECWGTQATQWLDTTLGGIGARVVLIEPPGGERQDRYGRALRYLMGGDEGLFINYELVAAGQASAVAYDNHVAAAMFAEAEVQARAERRGKWGATCVGDSVVDLVAENADAAGDDRENLEGEWVELRFGEPGDSAIVIEGWVIADESSTNRFTFGDYTVAGGAVIRLITGCGESVAEGYIEAGKTSEIYWCNPDPVWNNKGDTVFIRDAEGVQVGEGGW